MCVRVGACMYVCFVKTCYCTLKTFLLSYLRYTFKIQSMNPAYPALYTKKENPWRFEWEWVTLRHSFATFHSLSQVVIGFSWEKFCGNPKTQIWHKNLWQAMARNPLCESLWTDPWKNTPDVFKKNINIFSLSWNVTGLPQVRNTHFHT